MFISGHEKMRLYRENLVASNHSSKLQDTGLGLRLLEALGSICTQAFQYYRAGVQCNEVKGLLMLSMVPHTHPLALHPKVGDVLTFWPSLMCFGVRSLIESKA